MEVEEIRLPEPKRVLGIRVSAIIETIVFLAIAIAIDKIFGAGNRFMNVSPHPFWIIVLIMSCKYGIHEGLMAAALSAFALYFRNFPEMNFNESLFYYRVRFMLTPTLWFIAAAILGEMRTNVDKQVRKYRHDSEEAKHEAKKITENYTLLKEKKERIEVKLASEMRTVGTTYRALQHLESMQPAEVVNSLVKIVQEIIQPEKFSIFRFTNDGFELAKNHGWQEGENLARYFPPSHPLTVGLATKKKVYCVINTEDEKVLEGEGVVAAPLFDPNTGETYGMIKIEEIDFGELNLSLIELIEGLGEIVGVSLTNAKRFQEMKKNQIYSEKCEDVFSPKLYQLQKYQLKKWGKYGGECEIDLDAASVLDVQKALGEDGQIFCVSKNPYRYRVLFPVLDEAIKKRVEQAIPSYINYKWIDK